MTTIEIDKATALRLLREVVAEKGSGYVYTGLCVYAYEGACGCLIGHALHRAGVSIEQLAAMDEQPAADVAIDKVQLPDGLEIDERAKQILYAAQLKQDNGHTWGTALTEAIRTARNLGMTA